MSTSAFGVQHTVSKSLLPGGIAKPVHALSRAERTALRAHVTGGGPRGPIHQRGTGSIRYSGENRALSMFRQTPTEPSAHPKVRFDAKLPTKEREHILARLPKKIRRPVTFMHDVGLHGVHGMLGNVEGRTLARAGTSPARIALRPKASTETIHHEMVHAQSRRNYHRLGQVVQDPTRAGREEGRADALARRAVGGKAKDVESGYEAAAIHHAAGKRGNAPARKIREGSGQYPHQLEEYTAMRAKLGHPIGGIHDLPGRIQRAVVRAGEPGQASVREQARSAARRRILGKSAFGVEQ